MIELARRGGFCFGVRKALEAAQREAADHAEVFTFGPIIHNPQVVDRLKTQGVTVCEDPDRLPEGAVLYNSFHRKDKRKKQVIFRIRSQI